VTYTAAVGQRMRAVREERRMSLRQVEVATGWLHRQTLACWERGDRAISAESLSRYAAWLGVDVRLLLPPEPGHEDALMSAADRAARKAAADMGAQYPSVTPDEACLLLARALMALARGGQAVAGTTGRAS
jgi:transcriptional regulator with XRE-family HTH domain